MLTAEWNVSNCTAVLFVINLVTVTSHLLVSVVPSSGNEMLCCIACCGYRVTVGPPNGCL